jgi:NADH:ubiquinone oxidoreductase subunit H
VSVVVAVTVVLTAETLDAFADVFKFEESITSKFLLAFVHVVVEPAVTPPALYPAIYIPFADGVNVTDLDGATLIESKLDLAVVVGVELVKPYIE